MPVEIPKVFIERLRGLGPHFVRVARQGKEPVDKGWTTSPMEADDPRLQAWLREGGNYGVVGGFGLVIVDIDLEELKAKAKEKLPRTLTVESPGSKGWHLYYICSLENPTPLRDKDGENVGDIQGQGKMVVGPGSIHPNGGVYRIIDDRPLAQITREQLIEAFKDYVVPDREIEHVETLAKMERQKTDIHLDILQVVPFAGLKRRGDEYYGPHPVHGSKTGRNFWVNPAKNCWHCFRHGTGGGPLLWLAVEEGIIDCSEAGPGALRGEVFKRVLEKARERGLIEEPKTTREKEEPSAEIPPATEISETFTFTGDRRFNGRIQVGALATPVSRFTKLRFKCKEPSDCKVADCPLMKGLNLTVNGGNFDASAWATYFDTNNPVEALAVFAEKRNFSRCAEWRKKVVHKGREEKAVTHALVYDLTGREGRAWFIHGEKCDLKRAPNWIIAEGWLCRGFKGRIGVLILAFTSESEVMAPPADEVEKARALLKTIVKPDEGLRGSAAWRLGELLKRRVNAKGDEVARGFTGDLLTVSSPVWVKTPESGDRELGATTCELGPSTNYKSQRARFLVVWLGAGKYLRGRKTEAGLTAGLEKVEGLGWVCKKGAIPSADLSFLIVDNADPDAWTEQIESRRDGVVSMTGIKSMEVWARTRLKLLNNPAQPFDELVYKCVALKMFDPKLVARFAFALYTYGVPIDERYNPEVFNLASEEEAILDAAKTTLRWNLSQEIVYTVPLSLWGKIMEYSKRLEEKYGCEDIPLLLRNIPYKLAVVAYSFALLEGETEPSERHYQLAYEWLDYCARDIELDKYAEVQRSLRNLTEDEYKAINKAVMEDMQRDVKDKGGTLRDTYVFRLVDYIVKHGKSRRDELAAHLEVDEKTVTRKVNILKGLGILRSDKDGYSFTPKGVRFVKQWLPHVPDVSNVTASKGQTPTGDERNKRETPKSGDMKDIGDTNQRSCEVCGGPATTVIIREDGEHWFCGKCLADWEGNL